MRRAYFCRESGEVFEVSGLAKKPFKCPLCKECHPAVLLLECGDKQTCSINGQEIQIIKIPFNDVTWYYMVFAIGDTWWATRAVVQQLGDWREVLSEQAWSCKRVGDTHASRGFVEGCFYQEGIPVYNVLEDKFSEEASHGRA